VLRLGLLGKLLNAFVFRIEHSSLKDDFIFYVRVLLFGIFPPFFDFDSLQNPGGGVPLLPRQLLNISLTFLTCIVSARSQRTAAPIGVAMSACPSTGERILIKFDVGPTETASCCDKHMDGWIASCLTTLY
jgi:hypothetical protein